MPNPMMDPQIYDAVQDVVHDQDPSQALQYLVVSPNAVAITGTGTKQLDVLAVKGDGSTTDISSSATYVSSDTSKATVSGTGLVTGVAAGTSTITATYQGVSESVVATIS